MLEEGISCYGHTTSNLVEGWNGVVKGIRALHPVMMLERLVDMLNGYYTDHRAEAEKWQAEKKVLTPWAQKAREHEAALVKKGSYIVAKGGNSETLMVTHRGTTSSGRKHRVSTNPQTPSCDECEYDLYFITHSYFPHKTLTFHNFMIPEQALALTGLAGTRVLRSPSHTPNA
jgi:hypothetical protein